MTQVSIIPFLVGGAFLSLILFDVPYYLVMILLVIHRLVNEELSTAGTAETAVPRWRTVQHAQSATVHKCDSRLNRHAQRQMPIYDSSLRWFALAVTELRLHGLQRPRRRTALLRISNDAARCWRDPVRQGF